MSPMPRAYFEAMYEQDADPWGFGTRWYETRKYLITMAALPKETYRAAFEPGCSIGVLTEMLADRCGHVLAGDEIASAVSQAQARTEGRTNVEIRHLTVPDDWPDASFDLVVLSELAYYFDEPELEDILALTLGILEPGGTLVAVHWRGPTNYPLSGDRTHEIIGRQAALVRRVHHAEEQFVLDVWVRSPAA